MNKQSRSDTFKVRIRRTEEMKIFFNEMELTADHMFQDVGLEEKIDKNRARKLSLSDLNQFLI